MADQRTEQATPHHRQEARKQGQVVRSRELTASLVLLAGTLFLRWFAGVFILRWRSALFTAIQRGIFGDFSLAQGSQAIVLIRQLLLSALLPVALWMGSLFSVAALAAAAQGGGITAKEDVLVPQFARLSPASYAQQVFSLTGLARTLKSLAPTLLLLFLATKLIYGQFLSIPAFSLARVPEMYHQAYVLLLETSSIMLVWSGLDYLAEWRTNEQHLRMSKQEIREEMKEMEGSPQVRGRIRSIQRQMRRRQLKADVSRAGVVITNPTHYAVALEFHLETMQAPKVLAKGQNLIAEQIKEEARWAGVPIVENPPLARSLYRSVEVGQSIPYDLYTVVAEILAFLYRAELERNARARARRSPQNRGSKGRGPEKQGLQKLGAAALPPPAGQPGEPAAASAPHPAELGGELGSETGIESGGETGGESGRGDGNESDNPADGEPDGEPAGISG